MKLIRIFYISILCMLSYSTFTKQHEMNVLTKFTASDGKNWLENFSKLSCDKQKQVFKELVLDGVESADFMELTNYIDKLRQVSHDVNHRINSYLTPKFTHEITQEINAGRPEQPISEVTLDSWLLTEELFKKKWQQQLSVEQIDECKRIWQCLVEQLPLLKLMDGPFSRTGKSIKTYDDWNEFIYDTFIGMLVVTSNTSVAAIYQKSLQVPKVSSELLSIESICHGVRLLIRENWNLNYRRDNSHTILTFAALFGCYDVVQLLLSAGADFNIKNNNGETALLGAAAVGDEKIVELLLEAGADINTSNNVGVTVLMAATEGNNTSLVTFLLKKGIALEEANDQGFTPLMWAARNGKDTMVEFLLGLGANLGVRDNEGNTVLIAAMVEGNQATVQRLLGKGVDPDEQNKKGHTALMVAASLGLHDIIDVLTKTNADLNVQDENGFTALIWAIGKHKKSSCDWDSDSRLERTIHLLLAAGADKNIRCKFGVTAEMIARELRNWTAINKLSSSKVDFYNVRFIN